MNPSIELGRIAGIRIGINWSWLVVFALITWTLADAVFPSQNPGLSRKTYISMAVAAAFLFFGSLLLHELGHALQARREGMTIEGITLWLFGGVARFSGSFPSAGAEFRIAIAGPIVSLVLGVAFALSAWGIGFPDAIDGIFAWLGYINLTLLVFNLLPALPLDGGRLLRSAIWAWKGDFRFATLAAAGVARVVGYLLIVGGVLLLVVRSSFSGAWLAFVGWFLLQAAGGEARFATAHEVLGTLRVRDLMVRDPVTVPPDISIGRFMDDVAWLHRYTAYPVVQDGKALGLLSFHSLGEVPRDEWNARLVRDSMIPLAGVPILGEDDDAVSALAVLGGSEVGRGLVLDGERLAGLISISDLARAMELGPPRRRAVLRYLGRKPGS